MKFSCFDSPDSSITAALVLDLLPQVLLVVPVHASDGLETLISKMTYYMLSRKSILTYHS